LPFVGDLAFSKAWTSSGEKLETIDDSSDSEEESRGSILPEIQFDKLIGPNKDRAKLSNRRLPSRRSSLSPEEVQALEKAKSPTKGKVSKQLSKMNLISLTFLVSKFEAPEVEVTITFTSLTEKTINNIFKKLGVDYDDDDDGILLLYKKSTDCWNPIESDKDLDKLKNGCRLQVIDKKKLNTVKKENAKKLKEQEKEDKDKVKQKKPKEEKGNDDKKKSKEESSSSYEKLPQEVSKKLDTKVEKSSKEDKAKEGKSKEDKPKKHEKDTE